MMVFSAQLAEDGGARPPHFTLQYLHINSSYVAPTIPPPPPTAKHGYIANCTQINRPSPLVSSAGYDSTFMLIRFVRY